MRVLFKSIAAAVLALSSTLASAQDKYPSRPIMFVVAFAAGGSTDILARVLAPSISTTLGQPIVIENRGGADGNIAAAQVSRATPDGYTLLFTTNSFAINVNLYKGQTYDPIKSFVPIILLTDIPNVVVVHPSVEAKNLSELVALSKTKPLNFASTASGTYLATELLKRSTGLTATRIPYRGAGDAMPSLLGGNVQFMLTGIINVLPYLRTEKLRPIVVTSSQRHPALPNVPTVAEMGFPGYADAVWYGIVAPVGTPQHIVEMVNRAANIALADPQVRAKLEELTMVIKGGAPHDFGDVIKADVESWGDLIKATGVKFE
jgi:tripartite-type tricarboxylate transporter receptor subunit TctC